MGKKKGNSSKSSPAGKKAKFVTTKGLEETIDVQNQISSLCLDQTMDSCREEMIMDEIKLLRKQLLESPGRALDIVSNCTRNPALLTAALDGLIDYEDCIAVIIILGKLILSYPSASRFAEAYLTRHGSPFKLMSVYPSTDGEDEPSSKKLKTTSLVVIQQKGGSQAAISQEIILELFSGLLVVLRRLPRHVYSYSWDIKNILQFNSPDFSQEIRWHAYQCTSLLLHLSEVEMKQYSKNWSISNSQDQSFTMQRKIQYLQDSFKITLSETQYPQGIQVLDENMISFEGLVIKQKNHTDEFCCNETVMFPSFMKRVKDILIHVMNNSPVCVIGPIGSGKSTTIRQVFSMCGRRDYPDLISVQMNDQMDSRVILGSYHSTDLPGQFVWKPGCLTKAVLNGHWIIFEDIDAAPADVLTLLEGFMDTRTLSVAGYGEIDYIHPEFRIFATCRSLGSSQEIRYGRIGKLWKKVVVSNYDVEDLKLIVPTRFPHLRPIVDVLVNIFTALSSLSGGKSVGNARVLSVRDFLKFCQRISSNMDFTCASTSVSIFQDGLDLFVLSLSSTDEKDAKAETIGTHLNLLKSKAEYFLTMYTPSIALCTRSNSFVCGRFSLSVDKPLFANFKRDSSEVYSLTRRTCNTLEVIAGFIKNKEPVLLVGETGVGKTSCVQHLAKVLNRKLVVVNLNRQSDSVDLLGGYKPVELKYIFLPLREDFESLFVETFNRESNAKYLNHIMTCYGNKRWKDLIKLMTHVEKSAFAKSQNKDLLERWTTLYQKIYRVEKQLFGGEESPFAFSFIDGTLIKAIKNGYWILLDEINLATSEMLQCLAGVLDEHAQIHLWEKGDDKPIKRNENFHLFAAMNPSTDVGKKDLPIGIRNRFSELYVGELTDADELRVLVSDYLKEMCLASGQISNIVQFYIKIRRLAQTTLVDGLGKRPHYSLRTLCRALKIASLNLFGSILRSLYESFCLSFLTQLDFDSHPVVEQLVAEHIYGKTNVKSIVNQPISCPTANPNCTKMEGYWIPCGDLEKKVPEKYILTSSIRRNLKDISRIVSAGKLPILIQGATSVGKTSLIQYLAECSGNRCYRINNHQHTDLQEYIGSYQSDSNGKLVFAEGVLVQAMRKGEWIILDELNLAPSEVLEALNRLLDDNRQLFITETGITVTAHPRFMLFATQNPPGLYGGRKILSRAFRNRFVELHFDEIPSLELENILHLRCAIPVSYCKKIIGVMKDLQLRRKASAALQGKHGFATLRDLFRWAERYRLSGDQTAKFYDWDQHLADEGYLVLAGKERKESESLEIREVLEKRFKRQVDPNNLFTLHDQTSSVTREILELVLNSNLPEFRHIVWTSQMRKLAVLIGTAMKFKEPILLVGETGCGKTTVVQLLAQLMNRQLYCVNCHMNSEGSDFLGGLRPVRDHTQNDGRLFEWVDGPLVEAMETGSIFLADEISLADDSVLERLNSVLEPERTLLIAEKGEEIPKLIVADSNFHFIGTMNPGGDYGKKELSPALRNRLTEIWCDSTTNEIDLVAIVEHNLVQHVRENGVGQILVSFVNWLQNNDLGQKCIVSVRDYLSWVHFINCMISPPMVMALKDAIIHGACMTVLDGLGTGNTGGETTYAQALRHNALNFIETLFTTSSSLPDSETHKKLEASIIKVDENSVSCGPFSLKINPFVLNTADTTVRFSMNSPTTSINAMRVLRAMQLRKPILLEGSPGVGKTALVSALAKMAGYPLTRINLSEQTDISDLFGADLPVEGKDGGNFEWRDGPLLQALKTRSWILLDELNLASQSVLEGLNACLDHRGSVYIPELNRTFQISTTDGNGSSDGSRILGCQNPVRQGGARKGLPKSFLNRFIQVYVDVLSVEDFNFVLQKFMPTLPAPTIQLMATFASRLQQVVCQEGRFGVKGGPWDINLRDLMRWAELTVNNVVNEPFNFLEEFSPQSYVDIIYGLRMRTGSDRRKVHQLFCDTVQELFPGTEIDVDTVLRGVSRDVTLLDNEIICGLSRLPRVGGIEFSNDKLLVLQKDVAQLDAIMTCLSMGWMPVLTGPAGCGKTSLVRLMAELCGRKLEVMHPSPEMDTIELLGGFEQADIYRRVYDVTKHLVKILQQFVKQLVLSDRIDDELIDVWSSLKNLPNLSPEEGLAHDVDEEVKRIQTRADFLQTAYLKCKSFAESESRNLSMSSYENKGNSFSATTFSAEMGSGIQKPREQEQIQQKVSKGLKILGSELEQIYTHLKAGIQTGSFQWIDSKLIKSMENGEWLLIDGANRCSAAVLDRLNSLLEPNGSILLSERGSIDGNILEIKPDPEFRLILTVDPAYGEISRAMRNRGVEIYMGAVHDETFSSSHVATSSPPPGCETNDSEGEAATVGKILSVSISKSPISPFGITFFDLDNLLRAEGLKDCGIRKALINLHTELTDSTSLATDSTELSVFRIVSSTKEIVVQLQQGISLPEACQRSLSNWYMSGNFDTSAASGLKMRDAFKTMIQTINSSSSSSSTVSLLPVALQNFVSCDLYRSWKHLETLEWGLGQLSFMVDNQCGRKFTKDLVEDFLILSVVSRVIRQQDVRVLSIALGLQYPLKASFVNKLATILESEEFESFIDWEKHFWDIQEQTDIIVKFSSQVNEISKIRHLFKTLKISLRMYHQCGIFHQSSIQNPRKGSLGFVLKNLKFSDAGSLFEFLQAFWALASHYHPTYETCLSSSTATSSAGKPCWDTKSLTSSGSFDDENASGFHHHHFAQMWLDGLKASLWGKRLADICSETCSAGLPDEKLMANMNLIVQWISEQVVPTLGNLKAMLAQREIQTLVDNCFQTLSHCRDGVLLRRNKTFRDMCTSRHLTGSFNSESTNIFMQILSAAWSCEDYISKQNLRRFFASEQCSHMHHILLDFSTFVLKNQTSPNVNLESLLQVQQEIQKLHKSADENIDSTLLNIQALQEYQHIQRQSCDGLSSFSAFINPFLLACLNEHVVGNSIVPFIQWEDMERFRHLYTNFPVANIESALLLPVYASRILVDEEKMTYRISPLESNGLFRNNQEKLLSILSTELLTPQKRNASFAMKKLVRNFVIVLNGWKSIFADNCSSSITQFQTWINSLENLTYLLQEDRNDKKMQASVIVRIGLIMAESASYMMDVSSYLPAVDPVVEKEVLASYLEDQISVYNAWIQSKRLHQLVLNGRDLFNESCDSTLIHPYINLVVENIVTDTANMNDAKAGLVPRPSPPLYTSIMQEIRQFVDSFGSYAKAKEFSTMIEQLLSQPLSHDTMSSVVIQCENWFLCHRNFVHKLSKQFLYWDITAPFLSASIQACTGYQLVCDNIKKYCSPNLRTSLAKIVTFPLPFDEPRVSIGGIYEAKFAFQKANKNMFLSSLVSFGNKLKVQQRLTKGDVCQLQKYCTEISEWWRNQEAEKQRKKEEEDAFFVFKGKERAMEKTDDEQEEYDLTTTFPSFELDYKDLREVHALEDGFHTYNPATEQNPIECGELSLEDVESFFEVLNYAASLVANRWLSKSASNSTISYISPFMQRFEIGCYAFSDGNSVNNLGYQDEAEFIVGATVANRQLCRDSQNSKWDPTTYNFYYDPNILEAQKLQSIFFGLNKRISELLLEWPDHPALQQIMKIIGRIESFSIDSPIMKFLTGLELLLATCQEWEGVASKRVSIAAHLEELTSLIISWRKMELRFWKNLLEHTLKRQKSTAKTWWFHLFSVVMEIIANKDGTIETEENLLQLLHKFMESASIGEFGTRLELLENLHRYLVLLETHKMVKLHKSIQPFIWNTIRYYTMFKEQVEIKLNSLKVPIEKKLKEFMKISRWNDSNFYALLDSVKKSQKTLNKLVVEYKRALQMPVSSTLVADIENLDGKKLKYKLSKIEPALYSVPEHIITEFTPTEKQLCNFSSSPAGRKLFKKYSKLCTKVRSIVTTVLNRDGSLCEMEPQELNELTDTIIQKVHELQSQYIPDSGPQRKRALHNVHHLRRKHLAELFKTLQPLGLSFKKGVIKIQNLPVDTKVPFDFLTEPVDLSAGWGHFSTTTTKKSTADTHLIKAWDSCDNYFQKSIARISAMMKAFQSPSKELGIMIAERCKGFVVELFQMTCEQKIAIEKFTSAFWNLKVLAEYDCIQNTTISIEAWKNQFYSNICNLEHQTSQYRILFESMVDFPLDKQQQLIAATDVVLSTLNAIKKELFLILGRYLTMPLKIYTRISTDSLVRLDQFTNEICSKFSEMMTLIPDESILATKIKCGHELSVECQKDLTTFMQSENQEPDNSSGNSTAKFRSAAKKTLETVLLAFQNLDKFDESPYSTESTNVHDNISSTIVKLMDAQSVCEHFSKMQAVISKRLLKEDCSGMIEIYDALKPLVKQYVLTAQFYIKYFLEHHRETCKLLYVLAGLFGTLAQKGFCLPSDYKEEAAEEGAELDAKSGMGLGEGETTSDAKDVSDRIESEDQLEDTMKAGETVDPANKDLDDDEKGLEMNEDFEGKQQDKQERSKDKDEDGDEDSDSDKEEDLDKQMGDVDGDDEDILDDKMWGGSSDEEDENEDNKESNEGKGASQNEEPELAPKDSEIEKSQEPKPNDNNQKEQTKEFNEMDDEGEPNDDQIDPYHGQNGPEEEPEPMDLPDDLKLDGEDDKEGQEEETNPFDLDKDDKEDFNDAEMKDDETPKIEGDDEISDKGEDDDDGMDIDNPQLDQTQEDEENRNVDDQAKNIDEIIDEQNDNLEEENKNQEPEEEMDGMEQDNEQKTEDNAEPSVQDDNKQSNSNTSKKELGAHEKQETVMKSVDEEQSGDTSEKSSGQVNSEDGVGQEGQSVNKENTETMKGDENKDASRKPGETDEDRSISSELTKSRLKTVKEKNESMKDDDASCENDDKADKTADLYQHIKESEKHDALTIDNATSEQMNEHRNQEKDKESEELPKMEQDEDDENKDTSDIEDIRDATLDNNPPDLIKGLPKEKKKQKKREELDQEEVEDVLETPGQRVLTHGAQRPSESTYHTQLNLLGDKAESSQLGLISDIVPQSNKSFEEITFMNEWHELERKTIPLSQELCEQLRLILEPTQASKLKGDYKTGKRLNMRKVIPYIASGFRKDKIWLRRTQPSKREYQILLALDDSASMCDNQSKQMAFSAVAVVAKALSLLEVGQLAVASFGEDVQLLHPFDDPFTDFSGARLMQKFTFAQRKTRIVQLMQTTTALFNHSKQSMGNSTAPVETAQLLLIVSDGRAVCHEGNEVVKNAVKRAMEHNVFTVFIIVDNPENQHSIIDIQKPIFTEGKPVQFIKYMDDFPFPFYLILRDLSALPSVLSDALRQWFELVTSSSR